jgi:hypothetical protein
MSEITLWGIQGTLADQRTPPREPTPSFASQVHELILAVGSSPTLEDPLDMATAFASNRIATRDLGSASAPARSALA